MDGEGAEFGDSPSVDSMYWRAGVMPVPPTICRAVDEYKR